MSAGMRDPWITDGRCDGATGGAFGECSEDRVTVWHGMDTPARACGRHMQADQVAVFRGHRAHLESAAGVSA